MKKSFAFPVHILIHHPLKRTTVNPTGCLAEREHEKMRRENSSKKYGMPAEWAMDLKLS